MIILNFNYKIFSKQFTVVGRRCLLRCLLLLCWFHGRILAQPVGSVGEQYAPFHRRGGEYYTERYRDTDYDEQNCGFGAIKGVLATFSIAGGRVDRAERRRGE